MEWIWKRIALIIAIFIVTFYIIFPWENYNINIPYLWSYKLWLDLNWWIELDYNIDFESLKKRWWDYNENNVTDWLKSIIEKRVNSLWTEEPSILSARYWNEAHIIVQIPSSNIEDPNLTKEQIKQKNEEYITKAKEIIWKIVRLEFKEKKEIITENDKKERLDIANNLLKEIKSWNIAFGTIANKYKDQYENIEYLTWTWTKSKLPKQWIIKDIENIKAPFVSDIIETSKDLSYTLWEDKKIKEIPWDLWYSIIKINSIKEEEITSNSWSKVIKSLEKVYDYQIIFVNQKPTEWIIAKTTDWKVLDDRSLIRASVSMTQWNFLPQIDLTFNNEWAVIFKELTTKLIWKQLAIFVWWQLITSPVVNTAIPDWKAVITGNFNINEAKKLAQDINTGIVPAPIYLTSERSIDAKIWIDALKIIINAWIIWFILIFLLLIIIYRISWLMAWIALLIYIMLVLSIVKLTGIVLTLASIAWLVLSIWLAIDANILIFERSKEELKLKKPVLSAINIWFEKSWTAIWDSHVTSLVSAVILFIFGTNMIKWFWVMLGIWIIVSLFSAMWISKVLILAIAPNFTNKLKLFIGIKD